MAVVKLKSNKRKTFQLNKVGRKWGEVRAFGKNLISNLGDDIFTFQTKQLLLFNVLKQITPINKSLKMDNSSIEDACEKIITKIGLKSPAKLSISTDKGWREIKPKEKTNTEKFCELIIGLNDTPFYAYNSLLSKVNEDLKSISELIKWYEAQPYIQKYNNNNENPKNHTEKILYDFYKRCINERIEIINYQLFKLKDRAIAKSKHNLWPNNMQIFAEIFSDRPYHYAQPFSEQYFDSRKIDVSSHRMSELYIAEATKMQALYSSNPYKFYRLYFKRIPVQQHFQNFKFYLPFLPLAKNRNLIFEELIKLFKAKRWISFYALALPQVEGLFSEMCLVVLPEKNLSQKSLTHKVNSVRPFHYLSTSYFDYYQYHIPLQRNKFSHTGYDEDFKLKSYDLLLDLSHLLKIFYELDNPLVKIKKLHTRRNLQDYISLKDFVDYFKLVDGLKPQQKKDEKVNIDNFEKDFLSKECGIDYICSEIIQELPIKIKELVDYINLSFTTHHSNLEFEKVTIPEIDILLNNEKKFITISNCFLFKYDKIEELNDYLFFLNKHNKHIPSLQKEIKVELNKLLLEFAAVLKNINHTDNQIKKINAQTEEKIE